MLVDIQITVYFHTFIKMCVCVDPLNRYIAPSPPPLDLS